MRDRDGESVCARVCERERKTSGEGEEEEEEKKERRSGNKRATDWSRNIVRDDVRIQALITPVKGGKGWSKGAEEGLKGRAAVIYVAR